MSLYKIYLEDIEKRKEQGLKPKPIDDGLLVKELVLQIIDEKNKYREDSIKFLVYNTLPGTTSAAHEKSNFLKEIIIGNITVKEISTFFALELEPNADSLADNFVIFLILPIMAFPGL